MRKIFLLYILFLLSNICVYAQVVLKTPVDLMGSRFEITIVERDSLVARQRTEQAIREISRIEQLISEWIPNTEISTVNAMAGKAPVKVSEDVFRLTERALFFSEITNGLFDISVASMFSVWKFDGEEHAIPDSIQIAKSVEKVNYKNIVLDKKNHTIFLKEEGMKIGFGATGKGYAADKASSLLKQLGVPAGIVNASGDLVTWGVLPNREKWKIGIQNPYEIEKAVEVIRIRNGAMTTSGNYEKYTEINGKRYAHIINPKTGWPVSGITSVTVIGENAEFCNGLSTSIMLLGVEKGLELLKKHPSYGAYILSDKGEVIYSSNYKKVKRKLRRAI